MLHIADVSWVQLVLVEIGALFLVAAAGVFMRDASKPEHVVRGAREAQIAHDEGTRCKLPEPPIRPQAVVQYQRKLEGVMENVPEDIRAGDLMKTAKVHFKQSLKVQGDHRPVDPSVRW